MHEIPLLIRELIWASKVVCPCQTLKNGLKKVR